MNINSENLSNILEKRTKMLSPAIHSVQDQDRNEEKVPLERNLADCKKCNETRRKKERRKEQTIPLPAEDSHVCRAVESIDALKKSREEHLACRIMHEPPWVSYIHSMCRPELASIHLDGMHAETKPRTVTAGL